VWQLIAVWVTGSVIMGTVAVLVRPVVVSRIGGGPVPRGLVYIPVRSIQVLSPLASAAVLALMLGLFAVLAVLAWRMAGATWLAGGARPRLLWVVLVGAGGLAGWFFAATVTFALGFTALTQLLLAYFAGGLPFALAAGLLQRPWAVNLAAATAVAGLVLAGYVLVARSQIPLYSHNVFMLALEYLLIVFSGNPVDVRLG